MADLQLCEQIVSNVAKDSYLLYHTMHIQMWPQKILSHFFFQFEHGHTDLNI